MAMPCDTPNGSRKCHWNVHADERVNCSPPPPASGSLQEIVVKVHGLLRLLRLQVNRVTQVLFWHVNFSLDAEKARPCLHSQALSLRV